MIFNQLNFHGHLRLSGVCIRWKNLVNNDAFFMNTVKLNVGKMHDNHSLIRSRSYKHIDLSHTPWNIRFGENLQLLLETAESIAFGRTKRAIVNQVMPLCKGLKEIQLIGFGFEHQGDDPALKFNYPLPVKISFTACAEFLDRFNVITEISRFSLETVPTTEFMAKYGRVIKSLGICCDRSLDDFWSGFENLRLEHLYLSGQLGYVEDTDKAIVEAFFQQQALSLKAIEIVDHIDFFFDPMRMILVNLEKIKIKCKTNLVLRLNDLKILPKLKSLEYATNVSGDTEFSLDVAELTTLTELRVSTYLTLIGPKFRIVLPNQPLDAMEKLEICNFQLDLVTLEQIARTMPGLKVLDISDLVAKLHV
jgi:hypothetical protein